ncbi:MAG: Fe-S-containing protein [Bacteroidota bacterium]|jgi:hypothetical protein
MRKNSFTDSNVCLTNKVNINAQKLFCRIMISIIIIATVGLIAEAKAQVVTQPLDEQSTTFKRYIYSYNLSQTQKKDIRYLIVKASNGDIKTCFDACDVCYSYNKGYTQSGNQLRCLKCGNRFNIDDLGSQGTNGCWPGHLVHTIDGTNISINVSDLVLGAYLFPAQDITEVSDNKINVSDFIINSNNGELTVKMQSPAVRNFTVSSLDGKLYKSMSTSSNELVTEVYGLSNGVYLLSIEEGGKIITKTFFINK